MPLLKQKLRIDKVVMKKLEKSSRLQKSFQDPMLDGDGVGYVVDSLALYTVVPEAPGVSPAICRQSLDPTLLERHQRSVQDSRPSLVVGLD
jgi:hypothetical protein